MNDKMNRISNLFKEKKNILSIYFTAGFPKLNDTAKIIQELKKNGVNMIEIGMPFSDPLADGPTIQRSSEIALKNGMNIKLLFNQLSALNFRNRASEIPLLLMGYLNPILQFGMEAFCKAASEIGIDGIIIPDLPIQEYLDQYKIIFEKYNLKNIFLITPQTSEKRIRLIDEHSNGFIYMVSSSSTTGANLSFTHSPSERTGEGSEQENYFKRIQSMKLNNPIVIGFGISDQKTFFKACEYANGAIIGSAFIKAIEKSIDLELDINSFVKNILSKVETQAHVSRLRPK